jgi:Tfp pilus assembly protein PilF
VASYQKALADVAYSGHAAVEVNLGKALIGTGDFNQAIEHFNRALADASYDKPYQAQMGLGTAYSRLGMVIEAGTAYRNAALDDRNPNPTKALLNLGGCFTLLNRPQDAIEAYNAIFEFEPSGATLFKTWENLGRAYVATAHYREGLNAFVEALGVGKYSLSDEALADYQRAQKAVLGSVDAAEAGVAGAATAGLGDDLSGFDPFAPSEASAAYDAAYGASYPELADDDGSGYGAGNVPLANDTNFFTVADDTLIDMSKRQIKSERKLRHTGLKVLLVIVILLVLASATAVFGYSQGYGWPTQADTVKSMFSAHASGGDVTSYWIGSSDAEKAAINRIMDMVVATDNVEILYEDRQMTSSEIVVAAHLSQGGTIKYDITLERDLIGWKVSGLDMIFNSTQL